MGYRTPSQQPRAITHAKQFCKCKFGVEIPCSDLKHNHLNHCNTTPPSPTLYYHSISRRETRLPTSESGNHLPPPFDDPTGILHSSGTSISHLRYLLGDFYISLCTISYLIQSAKYHLDTKSVLWSHSDVYTVVHIHRFRLRKRA